jgi:hypothetical protein
MDRDTHARFLEYIESYDYFGGPSNERMKRDRWLALDAELTALVERERLEACTAEDLARLRGLRRALLRD